MNKEVINSGLAGLLIGVILSLLLAPMWGGMMGYRNSMMGFSNTAFQGNQMAGSLDAHFIEQMIPHHEDAITMAQLALQKSQRPEIRKLAQAIIDSQSKEIDQMKSWYKTWYGKEVSVATQAMGHGMASSQGMHMGMMGNETDTKRLENAADFDRAFIEEMIPHHQMAVMMASMLKQGTQRPEMQTLAQDISTAQTKEIDQMRQWYDAWF